MLVFRIHGGLGNQLFQYAAGRALSLRYGCDYQLDMTHAGSTRRIGLDAFKITAPEADARTIGRLKRKKTQWMRIMKILTGRDIRGDDPHFILDRTPDELAALDIDPVRNDYYFEGYYQSWRNFRDCEETVRAELTPRVPLDGNNATLAAKAAACDSISLHVRRGDYFTPKFIKKFGVPLTGYYRRAMRWMAERVENPRFYVFSDDHAWVRDNLTFDWPAVFVEENNDTKTYCDILLMSACRHHIIANSSFSWWGAWLDPNPDKQVVVPDQWFLPPEEAPPDLIPPQWTPIAVND